MNAQESTENAIRKLYRLVTDCDPYPRNPNLLILNKKDVTDVLEELTASLDALYEEYELTKESHEKAELEARHRNEAAIAETARKTEDIYAASMLYSNEALERVWNILHDATASMEKIYEETEEKLHHQEKTIRTNQTELKAQLQDMKDADRYLGMIEESHLEEEREKSREKAKMRARKKAAAQASRYADRQTEVRVNQEVLDRLGFTKDAESLAEAEMRAKPKQEAPVIRVNEQFNPKKKPELSKKKKTQPVQEEKPVFADSLKRMKPDDILMENLEELITEETAASEPMSVKPDINGTGYLDDDIDEVTDFTSEEFVRPQQRKEAASRMKGMDQGAWNGRSGAEGSSDEDDMVAIDLDETAVDWKGDKISKKTSSGKKNNEADKTSTKTLPKIKGFWKK